MEVVSPYNELFRDIKICRLCGSDDKENIDIFTSKPISSRSEDLLTKILTVYPLVLYKDDPLPQYICPKCIGNVSTTYQDIQQVMRQQNKWMNITKAVQPENKYFHILNVVEKSTKATKETIKTSYNIEISNIPLAKFLVTAIRENQTKNNAGVKTTNKDNVNESVVKNIQNKLESNGFTIRRIKVSTSSDSNKEDFEDISDAVVKSDEFVSCHYCKQKFSDLKILAQHQLKHLKLSVNKVFQKHFLPKHLRRGRLITLNDNKCIRCLNCWRIHKDNNAILEHWSGGECEFYCFVCGKEFPHSPKMLREHIMHVHGVSYRSIKSEFITNHAQYLPPVSSAETMRPTNPYSEPVKLNPPVVKKTGYKKPPPKSCTKNDDGTITCKICHKVFDNFRSSNSHMRKHKPPQNRYLEPNVAKSISMEKYNREDECEINPSTSSSYYCNVGPTNTPHIRPPRPPYTVIMKNGPLRGIKTKIVQKRHDFLNNFVANNRQPTQNTTMHTPHKKDDESIIIPKLLTPAINTNHMLINNTHNNSNRSLEYREYASNSMVPTIKSEPSDNCAYAMQQVARLCFICNERFSSNREYELHSMFVHNIN